MFDCSRGTVSLPGLDTFVASAHFKPGNPGKVRFSEIGDMFKSCFLGTAEQNIPPDTLRVYLVDEIERNEEFMGIGGSYETKLAQLWMLLEKQYKGQDGILMTCRYWNLFNIRDSAGKLRAVGAAWQTMGSGGWRIRDFSTEPWIGYDAHYHIFIH